MTHSLGLLHNMVTQQKQGKAIGVFSVCSSNEFVLEACIHRTLKENGFLLIEATCNQVNQYGGYSGLTPDAFVKYVHNLAERKGLPSNRILLGGDHLGPFPFKNEPASSAIAKAIKMIEEYVAAGFRKIHIDASMYCLDDRPASPSQEKRLFAERTAELCKAAEACAALKPDLPLPYYIIGTEVPSPGGASHDEAGIIKITTPDDAAETIDIMQKAFRDHGLEAAWERVIALVVQPGVEFGDQYVLDYNREKAKPLSEFIKTFPGLVFEAHSTDYQTTESLKQMVEDQFAILKVGPALTFSFREAVFALAQMRNELGIHAGSVHNSKTFLNTLEQVMQENNIYWSGYYSGTSEEIRFACKFSFSDRLRYYWGNERVNQALNTLLTELKNQSIPLTLISQYMPVQFTNLRQGKIKNTPRELIRDHINQVLTGYCEAIG